MAKIPADAAAEIEPDAARALVRAPLQAGVAALKDARQILRRNADAGITDAERFRLFNVHGNAALRRILQSVREHLLNDEREPLFVREDAHVRGRIVERQAARDELPGETPERRTDDIIELRFAEYIVRPLALQPEVREHHFHILLDASEIGKKAAGGVAVLALEPETHGGDGRFDLVRPDGVILHQVLIALLAARQLCAAVGIERERRETEQQRERARIRHGAQRQMEECERNAEQRRRQRKEQQHTAAAFQIISEQLHFSPTA